MAFDDPNLVGQAGLVPVMRLAERAGLVESADRLVTVPGTAGAHAGAKVGSIVAGMIAGADSIEDLDLVRHGGCRVCSLECGHRRHWARSCERARGGMCGN